MVPIPSRTEPQVNGFVLNQNGELDFSDLEQQYKVSYEEGFDNVILVDNCPIVGEDARKQKLLAFLRRLFSAHGTIKQDGIHMPMGRNPTTEKLESKGYTTFNVLSLYPDIHSLNMILLNKLLLQ